MVEPRKIGEGIRLIVCDLDGTLLNSQKQISSGNLAAIRAAQERGIVVSICSGRTHTMLETYSRSLGINGLLIAANGAVLFDTRSGEIAYGNFIDPGQIYPLLQFCRTQGMDHLVASNVACWFSKGSKRVQRFEQYNELARGDGLPLIPLREFDCDYTEALAGDIYKVLIAGLNIDEQRKTEAYIQSLNGLACTSSDEGLLDISTAGTNKGEGVRLLANALGLEKQRICVFGDYRNDIPMFEQAGLSIAMGNSDALVKKSAMAVTSSNDDDGVARAIERYIL
jgi:Cof subfamily protein (haloacid dehalogenase superfamily)